MHLSTRSQNLIDFLRVRPDQSQQQREQAWISEIERYQHCLASSGKQISQARLIELQSCRAFVSNTLKHNPTAIIRWNQAQQLISTWIAEQRDVNLDDLLDLNAVISESEHRGWRQSDIFTALVKHVDPADIQLVAQEFFRYLNETLVSQHIIYTAFVCRYWLLSIHPFHEANGRTSQFFADFFLLKNGFLPQAFFSQFETFLIGEPEKKFYMTPHQAFKRFAQSLMNAYKILLPKPIEQWQTHL